MEDKFDYQYYFNAIREGRSEEAEQYRISFIPDRLYKFFPLGKCEELDQDILTTLGENKIWFSNKRKLNDPYEFQGIDIDMEKARRRGVTKEELNAVYKGLHSINYGVNCFTANDCHYLPMWAYYTNDYQGFCVVFDVKDKNKIYKVIYENHRIKVGNIIAELVFNLESIMSECEANEDRTVVLQNANFENQSIIKMLLGSYYMKDITWKHENEYRVLTDIGEKVGLSENIDNYGLQISSIICGINCCDIKKKKLKQICYDLNVKSFFESKTSDNSYGLQLIEVNK